MMGIADLLQPSRLRALPPRLYETTRTDAFPQAALLHANKSLQAWLGLAPQDLLNGNFLPQLQAISTVYAGHQFGIYTSKLGDGRVHILGDVLANDATRWEIQLKGAGATPFARGNSGHMSLAEAMAEYLGCEAMNGLGIPSTRGLALIQYGPDTGNGQTNNCIFVRTAPSHLRFGHFEYMHNQDDQYLLKELADHVIEQYYPELLDQNAAQRYLQFLFAVSQRTARLLAQWQSVGFVHSVMNTDNMSILGLTLDYGVYGFMQEYDPSYSPNPDDDQQRYAFDQQVDVACWNCLALAEALNELLPAKRIPAALLRLFRKTFRETWLALMRSKLGLQLAHSDDGKLVVSLLELLQQYRVDYTRFFRRFSHVGRYGDAVMGDTLPAWGSAFQSWYADYNRRLALEPASAQQRVAGMLTQNPRYILRQSWLQEAIARAERKQDFGLLQHLLLVLQSPYAEHDRYEFLA